MKTRGDEVAKVDSLLCVLHYCCRESLEITRQTIRTTSWMWITHVQVLASIRFGSYPSGGNAAHSKTRPPVQLPLVSAIIDANVPAR